MKPRELFEHALAELDRMLSLTLEEQRAWMRSVKAILPPMVPAPDGGSLPISEEGAKSLRRLSDELRTSRPAVKSSVSLKRHYSAVEHAFGRVLARVAAGETTADLFEIFGSELERALDGSLKDSEHFFPCHVFVTVGESSLTEFAVGPVRFVPRAVFLEETSRRGPKSRAVVRYLQEGGPLSDNDSQNRGEMLRDALAECAWVATVVIKQTDPDMAAERATTCVRLALAIVRLITGRFETQRVRINTDEHLPVRSNHLSAAEGGRAHDRME